MQPVIFTIKNIVDIIKSRQQNEFDANLAVTGNRGDGKSSCIFKILSRFKQFDAWKHQVYSREDVINLLTTQQYGFVWDDEAINSGYKRDFQNRAQQEMIKFLTAYRDNFNIFASAIPHFFSLDKDLRDLYFLHLFVAERGIVHVHMPIQGRIYSSDRWDAQYNAKLEQSWALRSKNNPDFKPPYHKLTTFKGYLYFNDLTDLQKKLYKEIKKAKRKLAMEVIDKPKEEKKSVVDRMYEGLTNGTIKSSDFILQTCMIEGETYSKIRRALGIKLKDNGYPSMVEMLKEKKEQEKESNNEVLNLIR